MTPRRLTPQQARRAALAAQGLGRPRPGGPVGRRHIGAVVRRLAVVQIDSVNVLARAHYLPLMSRLGPYERHVLDDCSARAPRSLFEYWGHEAALLPVGMHRLMRWRMQRVHDDAWGGMRRVQEERPDLVLEVADLVRSLGPITSTQLEATLAHTDRVARRDWGWNWSVVKRALEFLFWSGEITSAGRDTAFRRRYAAPEAVLPRAVLQAPTPSPAQAQQELVLLAAGALGVATAADLADYFRLPPAEARAAIDVLVAEGRLSEVAVADWPAGYALPTLRVPRRVPGAALLAPFDPLIWFRPRTERLFGMRYRIEIYTPAHKRVHGYYVLPFLFDENLVARVDLKADRMGGRLLVRAAHHSGRVGDDALTALVGCLGEMAAWLSLDRVQVDPVGDLSDRLHRAVQRSPVVAG